MGPVPDIRLPAHRGSHPPADMVLAEIGAAN